jgi:hypothetical protein
MAEMKLAFKMRPNKDGTAAYFVKRDGFRFEPATKEEYCKALKKEVARLEKLTAKKG